MYLGSIPLFIYPHNISPTPPPGQDFLITQDSKELITQATDNYVTQGS